MRTPTMLPAFVLFGLVPALRADRTPRGPRREIVINVAPNQGAIRQENWKLVERRVRINPNAPADDDRRREVLELFDLASDPYEKTNLADKHPERVAQLKQRLHALRAQAAVPMTSR